MSINPQPHRANVNLLCPTCYTQEYPECTENLTIAGGFAPGVSYLVVVKDQFGNLYRTSATGNNRQELVIPAADFPQGLFSRFAGAFEFIFYADDGCTVFEPTLCGNTYPCVLVSFVQTTGSSSVDVNDTIGCCSKQPAPPDGNIVLSITQECISNPSPNPYIIVQLNVNSGTGTYQLQAFNGTGWDVMFTNDNQPTDGTIVFPALGGFGPSSKTFRVVSGNVVSNEVTFQLTSCLETLTIQEIEYTCDEGNGTIHADVLIQNPTGNDLLFQVNLAGVWTTILTMPDPLGGIQGAGTMFTIPGGDQTFRFYDAVADITSADFTKNIEECITSNISIDSVEFQDAYQIRVDWTAENLYAYGFLDLFLQISDDNSFFTNYDHITGAIGPDPFTGSGFSVSTASQYHPGKYIRLIGRNANGDIVHSNSVQLPGSFANIISIIGNVLAIYFFNVKGFFNGFDYYVVLEQSDDGISGWTITENIPIPASPISDPVFMGVTVATAVDGKYYRLSCLDLDDITIYSYIYQYNE